MLDIPDLCSYIVPMDSPLPKASPTNDQPPGGTLPAYDDPRYAAALKARRLAELQRLGDIGAETARSISRWLNGDRADEQLTTAILKGGVGRELDRTTRAICQVVALEMELLGERPAPNRDAPRKTRPRVAPGDAEKAKANATQPFRLLGSHPYDNGPLDEVIARVRRELRVAAPADDPFAPPKERKPRQPSPAGPKPKGRTRPGKPAMIAKRALSAKAPTPRRALMASAAMPARPTVQPGIATPPRGRGPPK
jgi:hypothetical protein